MTTESASTAIISAGRMLAWQKLGQPTVGAKTAAEAMAKAGMDWSVRKATQYVDLNEGTPFEPRFVRVRDRFDVLRTEVSVHKGLDGVEEVEALGAGLGSKYEVFQNAEAFGLFDGVVAEGNASYVAAGSLFDGKIIYVLARLNQNLDVKTDIVIPYLLLLSSHDGSTALRMLTIPFRQRGANTLRLALADHGHQWSVRHKANIKSRSVEVQLAASLASVYYSEFQLEAERLMNQTVSMYQVSEILEKILPKGPNETLSSKALAARDLYESDETLVDFKGTAWGVLNAASSWEEWLSPTRSEPKRLERHARETVFGVGSPLTRRAHKLLVAARDK